MLPTSFIDRFTQIMNIRHGELASEIQNRFSTRSAELAARGHLSPHVAAYIHHENAIWITKGRIESSVNAMKRLFSSGHELPLSETLARDLKELLESWTTDTWCKQLVDNYETLLANQRPKYDRELFMTRGDSLYKANLEIDLMVDELRSRTGKAQMQTKEVEQKFGILLSPKQARIDFEGWAKELGSTNRSIAILFIDIDRFKAFNTTYTETVVDETLLPGAMTLINKLAAHRGGAYRQGGEEFLVILSNYDQVEASAFAEKLRSAFESTPFMVGGKVECLTISIGVALWPQHGQGYDEVLKSANVAKAEAKRTRNSCAVSCLGAP